MMILVNQDFADAALRDNSTLDLRNITTAAWPRVVANCRAQQLRLYHITLRKLDGIENLRHTTELELEWATKIDRLDPVFRIPHLSKLSVYDFPKLLSLEGIECVSELTEFNLSGSRGAIDPPLRLATIKPVAQIPRLSSFSLANARIVDDDICCLAECSTLRHLHLSKNFERRQFALLAKRLNQQLEEPIVACVPTNLACKRCGEGKMMFYGRKMPFVCRECEESRFAKLVDEFETMKKNA